ncbi:MAG: DUF4347 domain-containing protein [Planctomycetales bacterium]|nr:DUF4347 domain-containing protein [Planctomycetales bacterium]
MFGFLKSARNENRTRRLHQNTGWSVGRLENRILLAGDVAAAAVTLDAPVADRALTSPALDAMQSVVPNSSAHLVFIDSRVEQLDLLAEGVNSDSEFILIDSDVDAIDQISRSLAGRTGVQSIQIIAHGSAGSLQIGLGLLDSDALVARRSELQRWGKSLDADADILLLSCDTGAGTLGARFIEQLASLTGADVAASTDRTGNANAGGDWLLERQVGTIEASIALSERARENYDALLPITIYAAGETGNESMSLLIDGVEVQRWDNVGGDATTRDFQTFTYNLDGITGDQVRVALNNDLWDPQNGIDYNLIVDKIEIDGTILETEDPSVYSTGTWLPADGITPGYRLSETLHTIGYFQYAEPAVPGGPGSVVINEIHYNPGPDGVVDPDAEFIELYNPGTETVSLAGMSFVGFTLTFAPGTTLAAGEYAIVSPSASIAEAQWGVTPLAEFTSGGLSGSGELIQLIGADGTTIIDEVSYDDVAPWPGAPDGTGPSLELINPTFDNADPQSWRASTGDPTPGAINSVYGTTNLDQISDITLTPGTPLPGEAIVVSATIPNATEATLTYKLNFNADQTIAMTSLGNDLWEATIPGQVAGTLVRYRIDSDVAVAPFVTDTINYFGVVVESTDIIGNDLPVFQWFVDPVQFEDLVTNLYLTNTEIETVVAYDGQVIDNATVRVRGDFSRTFDKKSFKIELPKGYTIDFGTNALAPMDEFGLFADFVDWDVVSAQISWEIFNAETDSYTSTFFTRVEQNGDFYGVYRLQELYDGAWRTRNGYNDGEFFKADEGAWNLDTGFERKNPDSNDLTSIYAARDILYQPSSAAKTAWVYDTVDVPSVVNYMALSALTRHYDQFWHNFYMSLDGDTGRWEELEWDFDVTWRPELDIEFETGEFTTPEAARSVFLNSVWEVPEFQAMYWQRLQTLVDTYLSDDSLVARRDELIDSIGATNSALEYDKWGRVDIFQSADFELHWQEVIAARQQAFANELRLPGANTTAPSIVINELHYNPAGSDAEFVELLNTGSEAVDLSGWEIDGVGLVIQNGTVILPGSYLVFTDNDRQFRQQSIGNVLVGGQYSGGLSGGGETITLLDKSGAIIDQVTYDDVAPWPTSPDGDGFTLALIDPASDNSVAASWAASNEVNGTPGRANLIGTTPTSTIVSLFVAGQTTNEVIELEVNGQIVASFNLGTAGSQVGDYFNGNFVELRWGVPETLAISQVRVHFVNDLYDPVNNIDYNVRIDRMEIGNGVTSTVYETEAPTVLSTGTYVDGVGFEAGNWESEYLHGYGYFEYIV